MATPRRSRVHKGAQRTRTAPSRHPLERAPDKFIGGPQPHAPRVPRGRGELQNGRRRRGRPQGIVEAARIDAFTASSSIRRTVSHSFGSPTSLKNGRDAFGAADRARRDGPGRPRPPSPHRLDVGRRAAPSPSFGAPYEDLWSVEEANRRQAAAAPLNHGPIDGVGSIAHRFAGAPGSSGGASNRSGASFGAADRATRARLMRPGGDAANADKRGLDGPGPAVASPRDWSRSRTGAVMLGGGPGARDSYALPQPGSGHSVDRGPGAYSGASPSSFGRQTESGRRSARAGGMGSLRRHLAADADSPGGFSTFAGKELGVPGPGSVPRAVRSSVGKQTESLYVTLPRPKISPAGYISVRCVLFSDNVATFVCVLTMLMRVSSAQTNTTVGPRWWLSALGRSGRRCPRQRDALARHRGMIACSALQRSGTLPWLH